MIAHYNRNVFREEGRGREKERIISEIALLKAQAHRKGFVVCTYETNNREPRLTSLCDKLGTKLLSLGN